MTTMRTRQNLVARGIAEQAAEWLLALEEGRAEDNEAFADWLRQSPLHVGAFLRASAVDALGARIDPTKSIEVDPGPFEDVVDLGKTRHGVRAHVPGVKAWGLVASVAALALVLGALLAARLLSQDPWKHYSAAVGEQRTLELDDGTVMYLGPGSSVDTLFGADERRLRLVSGEAMFQVHHDTSRPFRVHTGRMIVQAVGTQFSVSRILDDSVVSVVEGVVQLSRDRTVVERLIAPVGAGPGDVQPVLLRAGQEARAAGNGEVTTPRPAKTDPVKSWKSRRLTFVSESLHAIAEEFNRYNRAPKIRIGDDAAGELRFAAVFDANDPESLVSVLEGNPKLSVERKGSEIVILSK